MYISFNLTVFYLYFFNATVFKVSALEPESVFVIFCTERGGLVTGGTSNEACFEGCNKMKKVLSYPRGTSKLSVSQCEKEGLT